MRVPNASWMEQWIHRQSIPTLCEFAPCRDLGEGRAGSTNCGFGRESCPGIRPGTRDRSHGAFDPPHHAKGRRHLVLDHLGGLGAPPIFLSSCRVNKATSTSLRPPKPNTGGPHFRSRETWWMTHRRARVETVADPTLAECVGKLPADVWGMSTTPLGRRYAPRQRRPCVDRVV